MRSFAKVRAYEVLGSAKDGVRNYQSKVVLRGDCSSFGVYGACYVCS
jgi:hypothetical protein